MHSNTTVGPVEAWISQAATLLEALPYIQRFRGETFVIKYGGSFMDSPDPAVRAGVARDIVFLEAVGINPVVIHGGGKAITRAMEKAGVSAQFVHGQRITDAQTVAVVEKVLSQEINVEIVRTLQQLKGQAKGFSGTEIFTAEPFELDPALTRGQKVNLGFVGNVTAVDTRPLMRCIEENVTPVISPTGRDLRGQIYNCNADVAAAQAAISLKARRLIFMSDVPGLMRDPNDPSTLISTLASGEVEALKRSGVIDRGMIPKMDSALEALKAGVEKVSLVDGRMPHAVLLEIFTDAGIGTEVVK